MTGQSVFSVEDLSLHPLHLISLSLNVRCIVSLSFAQTEESNICMYSFININVPGALSILPELGGSAKGLYSRKTHF